MARLTITRQWPDGSALVIDVKADDTYPEALAQAKLIALDAYQEALAYDYALDATVEDEGE